MVKLKYNVSGTEPNQASMGGEQPKPGLYDAEIHEINVRDDRGPGKETDLEVIYRLLKEGTDEIDGQYNRVWDYVGWENETTEWKRAQFLEAIKVVDEDDRKGDFDPEDHAVKVNGKETSSTRGTFVKLRIRPDSFGGQYKAKVGAVLPVPSDEDGDEDPFE